MCSMRGPERRQSEDGQSECDAKCDSAGVRIRQHGAAQNDRTRCHHSGCSGFFETCASYRNWPAARGRAKNSLQGPWMAWRVRGAAGCRGPSKKKPARTRMAGRA